MRLQFTLAGVAPLIMHNLAAGLDTRSPVSREIAEIAAKKGGNRTDVDDLRLQELECQRSLYLGADGKPTLPPAALRAMIEAGARTVRQGPQVRGGLLIEPEVSFRYDVKRYGGTLKKLVETAQFTAPVVVQGKSILRPRAPGPVLAPPLDDDLRSRCRPCSSGQRCELGPELSARTPPMPLCPAAGRSRRCGGPPRSQPGAARRSAAGSATPAASSRNTAPAATPCPRSRRAARAGSP